MTIPPLILFWQPGLLCRCRPHPVHYPSGEAKAVIGQCYQKTGILGAKLAIVACRKSELRGIIQEAYRAVPRGALPISYNGGGPFALDNEANKYDCVLIYTTKPSFVPDWISFYSQFGIWQFKFMLGATTFVQGDFSFPTFGSAVDFKKQITVDMSKVSYVKIYQTNNIRASVRKVEAVPTVSNALTNPTVHIGRTSVTFNGTIKSGEYVEYTTGDQEALVYDNIGNSRSISVSRSGRFRIPRGQFTAHVSGTPEVENAPSEVILTFGLYGKFIRN